MPFVARVGDPGVPHCTPYVIASGSPNVFVEGKPVARGGDISSVHKMPAGSKCVPHTSAIIARSKSVFVNGLPIATVGDLMTTCTAIASGSLTVIVGI